jgi:hypothetical protein
MLFPMDLKCCRNCSQNLFSSLAELNKWKNEYIYTWALSRTEKDMYFNRFVIYKSTCMLYNLKQCIFIKRIILITFNIHKLYNVSIITIISVIENTLQHNYLLKKQSLFSYEQTFT